MDRVNIGGLYIAIKNPQGSTRSGVDREGTPWASSLADHYGYIKGTIGNDKDHVDAFVRPGTPHDYDGTVYVVDQMHPETGAFDEHKAMIGYDSEAQAREAYAANYAPGWDGLRSVTAMPMDGFKSWVRDGTNTTRPAAGAAPRIIARAGRTRSSLEDLSLRSNADGTVTPHLGERELLDAKTGIPIKLPADVSDFGAKKAIRNAGAVDSDAVFMAPRKTTEQVLFDQAMPKSQEDQRTQGTSRLSRIGTRIAHQGYEKVDVPRVSASMRLSKLITEYEAGKLTPAQFDHQLRALAEKLSEVAATKSANRLLTDRERGIDIVRERLIAAGRRGDIDRDSAEFALWALGKNPDLAESLGISVRKPNNTSGAGQYNPAASIITLFKGAGNTGTAVHEILHHSERMMPPEIQDGIRKEWGQRMAAAIADAQKQGDAKRLAALQRLVTASAGSEKAQSEVSELFRTSTLKYDADYQLVNPSEFWAVNATDIMSRRYAADSWIGKAKQWMVEMIEKAKGVVGMHSDAPVLRALDAVLSGDGSRQSKGMLSKGDSFNEPVADGTRRPPASPTRAAEETPASPPGRALESAKLAGSKFLDAAKGLHDDMLNKVSPMSTGSAEARATAKDYANAERLARWQWARVDAELKKGFTDDQRRDMWNAADEQNTILTRGNTPGPNEGINRLPPDQRAVMDQLHDQAQTLFEHAQDLGMVQGDGVAYWTPRMVAMIGDDGTVTRPASGDKLGPNSTGKGGNVSTSAGSLKKRNHETADDTEAAAKAKLGDDATVVRDIRTMPLAMAKMQTAVAARELVNQIKEIGRRTGMDTVSTSEGPQFFTLDHPAFKTYKPRMEEKDDGTYAPVLDEHGNPVIDRVPIYISKDFEGPLKAIMSEQSGPIYNGLMALKAKSMSVVMLSPMIHNAVEYGRAFPMMPGKMLTLAVYRDGAAVKRDQAMMREAIGEDGVVPIGHRGGMQDITGLLEHPDLQAGRSWTAKALAAPVGLVSKPGALAVKKGVDAAGDFWHNTLLWDRIGDLQMGLWKNAKDFYTRVLGEKGLAPDVAKRVAGLMAGHWANRYAGALPNEAMSSMARKFFNIALFSRSFTLGNIGAMKDMFTGFPKDVRAQMMEAAGEMGMRAAVGLGQRKARAAFVLDLGLMCAVNATVQSFIDWLKRGKDSGVLDFLADLRTLDRWKNLPKDLRLGALEHEYINRFSAFGRKVIDHPLDMIAHPWDSLFSLTPNSDNEPGKDDRVLLGYADDGTAKYGRIPFGKIGEDFKKGMTNPGRLVYNKTSQFVKPFIDIAAQSLDSPIDGRAIWAPSDNASQVVGKSIAHLMAAQVPMDSIQGAVDWYQGNAKDADKAKLLLPLAGITVSSGAPGGPAVGEMYAERRRQDAEVHAAMPAINRLLKLGEKDSAKWDKALQMMQDLKLPDGAIDSIIEHRLDPESRLSDSALDKFYITADDKAKERMAKALSR